MKDLPVGKEHNDSMLLDGRRAAFSEEGKEGLHYHTVKDRHENLQSIQKRIIMCSYGSRNMEMVLNRYVLLLI